MKVTKIMFGRTHISITWELDGILHESMLYRHSGDYSWHLDPETRAMTPKVINDLQTAVMVQLIGKASARKKAETKPRHREKVSVWFADRP